MSRIDDPRAALVLTWREIHRARARIRRQIRALRELDSHLEELQADAEHEAAGEIRRDGPVEMDGRRYSAVVRRRFGEEALELQVDPLPAPVPDEAIFERHAAFP